MYSSLIHVCRGHNKGLAGFDAESRLRDNEARVTAENTALEHLELRVCREKGVRGRCETQIQHPLEI